MKFKYLVHIFIFGLVFTLVSCDAKKSSTNTLSTIAAYSGTIDVSVVNESATVSWQAQSGDSYKIYYSGSADPNASGWTLATTSPVTASPATISIGSTGNNQTIYFRITRVSGSGESAKSSAYVYATLPASFVFDSSKLRMSGGTVYVSSSINSLATTWELYRLPSGTSPRVDWIKVATGAVSAGLVDSTLTQFVDGSGVPLTFDYALDAVNGNARRSVNTTFSPSLSVSSILPGTISNASTYNVPTDGSIIANSGAIFWVCASSQVCALDNPVVTNSYPTTAPLGTFGVSRIATNATTTSGTVYFIAPLYNRVGGVALNGVGASGYTTITSPVDLAIDANNVYVATATSVIRIAQSALSGTSAASSTLSSTLTGVTGMLRDGTTLYIATDVGIKKIASIDTAPVVSDVFLTNPVKALTLDSTNSKLYYLAPSLIKANTDAIFELNLASPTSAVAVQDYLYGAKNLQFASGALHWRTALQAYSLNLATSALSLRVRDAYSVSAFAADSSGGVFLQIGSVPGPIYLPAQYAYAATAPSAITATYVYQYDQYLQISWGTVPGADAVSVTANGTTQIVAVPTTTTNILGLTNNTAYPVSIVPLNATGAGVATNNTGTPVVAAPYNIVAVPQAGQIRFDITANSNAMRNLTMNVYGSATMPVDTSTSATPLASATASFTAGSATNSITYATANDNILYYNATLIEGATGSVSAAKYAASAESWTNSAAAATQVSGANVPAIDTPTNLGSVNAYVYWTNAGGVADTVYRSNTAGTLPHSEAVTALNALDILASDGASLYGYDTGLNKVYAVNNANNATATNVTMTEILSTTLLTAFNSAPTSLAVSVGTLYVGAANGNIYAVDWNGTAASNQRLIWSTGGGYVCELTTLGSDLYWVQDYTTGFGCAGTGYSSNYSTRIRRGLSDGTGVVDDLVTVPYYRVTHIQTALVSLQPYLYYSTPSDNKIHRMNLTTLATDTPVSEIVRGYFAVNPTTGKLYYTDNTVIGVAFTLDAQNRKTAHKTGGGTSTGISLLNINATPKLYLYGDAAAGLFEALP